MGITYAIDRVCGKAASALLLRAWASYTGQDEKDFYTLEKAEQFKLFRKLICDNPLAIKALAAENQQPEEVMLSDCRMAATIFMWAPEAIEDYPIHTY